MDVEELLGTLRDSARLRALADLALLDTPPEERFDRFTQLARQLLGAPTALLSFLDDERQFIKSESGLGEPYKSAREAPLSHSLCKYVVAGGKPLVIEDAPSHPLARDNPAVSEQGVKAYAGIPVESDGHAVGALCVIDGRTRSWTAEELASLRALAAAVASEIELSRVHRELRESRALLNAITGSVLDTIITIDGTGAIVFCNDAVEATFGHARESLYGRPVTDLMPERYRAAHRAGIERVSAGGESRVIGRVVELHGLRADGEEFPLELSLSRWTGRAGSFYTAVLRDASERTRALRALHDAEQQLRLTFDGAPIGMALVGTDGRFLRVNDALSRILGYPQDVLLSLTFQTVTHADDLEKDLSLVNRLLAGEIAHYSLDKRYVHRAGHIVFVQLAVSLVRSGDGAPSFFIAQIEDVSERRHAEAEASLFFETSRDLLAIFDSRARVERVNAAAWEKTLGWTAKELMERPYVDFIHPEDRERTRARVVNRFAGRSADGFRNRYFARDGKIHWLEWSAQFTEEGKLFCTARDVTKAIEHEQEIRQAAIVDELTRLHNRRGFMLLGEQLLSSAARYGRPLFVLFADLNGLKQINDELGHDLGDVAIRDMAEVLRITFRKADVLGRLGGDEFVVLAEGDEPMARLAIQRLEQNLSEHNESASRPFTLSASLGVAHYDPSQARGLTELVSSADKLMYDAKRRLREARAR